MILKEIHINKNEIILPQIHRYINLDCLMANSEENSYTKSPARINAQRSNPMKTCLN